MSGNATNSANFVPAFVEIFKQVKGIFIDNPVEVFTKWTGGREHSFITQRDLENAITGIGSELHSEYMITYTPNNKDEGGFHAIQVTRAGARRRENTDAAGLLDRGEKLILSSAGTRARRNVTTLCSSIFHCW